MIVVRLMGGLGNQLFQYALGRQLSFRAGTLLRLDCSLLARAETPRQYELHEYGVAAELARRGDVRRLSETYPHGAAGLALRAMHRLRFGPRHTHIVEKTLEFDPEVLEAGDDVLLEGYWQSPRYFESIEEQIRHDLRLRECLPAEAEARAAALRDEESVCIHVRRGDYADNPRTAAFHGMCPPGYYAEAVQRIEAASPRARFHVFSDDPDWVRTHFKLPVPFRCEPATVDRPAVDLSVMSSCSYFVIANSSYSWWAAWLSASDRKMVIAPRKWGTAAELNTTSRFPPQWIVL